MAPLEEERIPVDLSDVLDEDEDLGIDQSELESDVQTDGEGDLIPHDIEVADLLFQFLFFLDHWGLVVDLDALLHPLRLKALNLCATGDAGELEAHLIAVDAARQQFQGVSVAEAEEVVHFGNDYGDDPVLLLLPEVVGLQRTAHDDVLVLDLPHLLHVEVDDGYLGDCREDVMELLGEVLGVAEEDDDSLLLVDELLDGEEGEAEDLAAVLGGGDDDVVDVAFDLQQLLLEVRRDADLQFVQALRDRRVVPEELPHLFLLLHLSC